MKLKMLFLKRIGLLVFLGACASSMAGSNSSSSSDEARQYLSEIAKPMEMLFLEGRMMSTRAKATELGDFRLWSDFKQKRIRIEYDAEKKPDSFAILVNTSGFFQSSGLPHKFIQMELKEMAAMTALSQLLFAIHQGAAWKNILLEKLFDWEMKFKDGVQHITLLPATEGLLFQKAELLFTDTRKLFRVSTQLSDGVLEELYVSRFESLESKKFPDAI